MSDPSNSWRVAEASAAWRPASGDFLDVNVWLALSYRPHPFHAAASQYWQLSCEQGTPLWFSRSTMMGLVRLLSQPRLMGPDVMTLAQAMHVYEQWLAAPGVALLPDPPGLDQAIGQWVLASAALPARLWTDLSLAATARTAGLRMVSFDRDFERFELDLCLILPSA